MRAKPRLAGWRSSALLALAAAAITAVMWLIGWLPPVDRATSDLLVRVTGTSTQQRPPVIAVLIDDQAVADHGPLPWPRDRLARLVSSIAANNARVVVLDLLLSEPGDQSGDQALADALAATPHVLAAALDLDGEWLLPLEEFGGAEVAAHAYGEVGPDGVVRTIAATKQAQDLALRYGLVLLPVAALVTTVVLSALLREAVESQAAQSESGRLLESLLVHTGTRPPSGVPKTASGRLEALQELQAKTLREDATRQALLAGMEDGVVMWGTDGEVLEANAAAKRLIGTEPDLDVIMTDAREEDDLSPRARPSGGTA